VIVTRDTIADVEPLDNIGWHALTGPQQRFGTVIDGLAARCHPDVAVFCALADDVTGDAWEALRTLVGPGGGAVLFRRETPQAPAGWQEVMRMATRQMLGPPERESPDAEFIELTAADAPEMQALVARTRPGPFEARTHELGTYLGYRAEGALVAMAGMRMRCPGFGEVSAVCTDDEYRGRGLASRLVRAVGARITAAGDQPLLHVLDENTTAIRVYEALGYKTRMTFEVSVYTAPD
jgi:ribosomal protein S18 acetylase RimI-like enzyme